MSEASLIKIHRHFFNFFQTDVLGWFSLVILTSHFKSTRDLFWDGPRNFEQWSDDEHSACARIPSPNFRASGRTFDPLRMIWRAAGSIHDGSSVESGFEPETLWQRSRHLNSRPLLHL
ncbi:hypothetical protein AVEN_39676-1 [Araneus ventricosus]|uniref:Uncharacterized protein n=1 Tax=Araneus ventricosus TaxID=182803 RepID=A0A4Y2TVN8_ARAVE|nr:hypothetical protein AVEN_39676-1 [Araneus ventricosus]